MRKAEGGNKKKIEFKVGGADALACEFDLERYFGMGHFERRERNLQDSRFAQNDRSAPMSFQNQGKGSQKTRVVKETSFRLQPSAFRISSLTLASRFCTSEKFIHDLERHVKKLAEQIEKVASLVAWARKIIVFTGAGVSTESGIPDFRGPDGLWSKYDPDDFTIERFVSDREVRKKHWQLLTGNEFIVADAKPNAAHFAITELQSMGKLYGVVTQNIDGLHQKAGVSEELVFELHGDLSHAKCMRCQRRFPIEEVKGWLKPGVDEPQCPDCSGMLKPDAVFFGEELPLDVLMESEARSRGCDLCIVLGSTLVVYPAAGMPVHAARSGAKLVIINMGPTALDDLASVRIEGKAGEIMPQIIAKAKEHSM